MKRLISYVIISLLALAAPAQLQFKPDTWKELSSLSGMTNVVASDSSLRSANMIAMHEDWPEGQTEGQALIYIQFMGLSSQEMSGMVVSADPKPPIKVVNESDGGLKAKVFVPLDTRQVTVTHEKYGQITFSLPPPLKLKNETVYRIDCELNLPHTVLINPIANPGVEVTVTLGKWTERPAPATFENVTNGEYEVVMKYGQSIKTTKIRVDNLNLQFSYITQGELDLRSRRKITLNAPTASSPEFFVNDKSVGSGNNVEIELPYGTYTIAAKDGDLKDEKIVIVDDKTPLAFYFSPQSTKTFEIVGMYNGQQVPTTLYVKEIPQSYYSTEQMKTHRLTVPADNRKYRFYLTYQGHKASKVIHMKQNDDVDYQVNLGGSGSRASFLRYRNDLWGFDMQYVLKRMTVSTTLEDGVTQTVHDNCVWDDGVGKWLKGASLGFHFKPALPIGLGLYTGYYLNFFFSSTDDGLYYDSTNLNHYFEWGMTMPLHVLYQFAFGPKVAIAFHTGPSLDVIFHAVYYDKLPPMNETEDDNVTFSDCIGVAPWPQRVNFAWDFGLMLRFGPVKLSGSLSTGFTDHKCFPDFGISPKSKVTKATLGIGFNI